jgi:O-antigen biosynthesis protein
MTLDASSRLKFTGERFLPELRGEIAYEHLHRYALCLSVVAGKTVLDIASGEGFGSSMLARTARSVAGVDIDETSIAHAQATYGSVCNNLSFVRGDCYEIPSANAAFDVVVSFETIEHIADQGRMLTEVRRVLKPNGLFICSTPDKDIYSLHRDYVNEFHVKELSRPEFESLIGAHFKYSKYYGQRMGLASFITSSEANEAASRTARSFAAFTREHNTAVEGAADLLLPRYCLAFCSDHALTVPQVAPSIFLDKHDDLFVDHDEKIQWARRSESENQANQLLAIRLSSEISDRDRLIADAHIENKRQTTGLRSEIENRDRQIAQDRAANERHSTWLQSQVEDRDRQIAQDRAANERHSTWLQSQVEDRDRQIAEDRAASERHTTSLQLEIDNRDRQIAAARAENVLRLNNIQTEILKRDQLMAETRVASEAEFARLQSEITTRDQLISDERRSQAHQVMAYQDEVSQHKDLLLKLKRSSSWRVTAPFRILSRQVREVLRAGRRQVTKVIWREPARLIRRLKKSTRKRVTKVREHVEFQRTLPAGISKWLVAYLSWRYQRDEVDVVYNSIGTLAAMQGSVLDVDALKSDQSMVALVKEIAASSQLIAPLQRPDASIVIPVHNALLHTLMCLRTLFAHPSRASFEVIIADDASSDATPTAIRQIGGRVHLLRQGSNQGFLLNCNLAAAEAKGRHIVFLNNDTMVLPGWLDELVGTLDSDPKIGLVCSKLLNVDGTLQEAGGIFWSDGSAWNYGRNKNARGSEFNFVKDTDYGSAAAIALPRDRWRDLDGFDEIYQPAYCEDADLAFRMRRAGYRTVYNPFAEVIHHEGVSHGRDESVGIKAHQVTNLRKFSERWQKELARDHHPNGTNVSLASDRSQGKPHILFVDHYVPRFDRDAGSRAIDCYMQLFLDSGFKVTFWPDNQSYDPSYTPRYQRMGIEVVYCVDYRLNFSEWLSERANEFDYAFLSRPDVALKYVDAVRRLSKAEVLYFGVDLYVLRMQAERRVSATPPSEHEIAEVERSELAMWRAADVIYYPSTVECDYVAAKGFRQPIRMLPLIAFSEDQAGPRFDANARAEDVTRLVTFVGGFQHKPNVDGIIWFCSEVWPRIRAHVGGIRLTIVGSNPTPAVLALAAQDVTVTGYVSDAELNEIYSKTDVVVAPLRFGAGVKGKVLEALNIGIPLVTTSFGAQGIPGLTEVCSVVDDASCFADAVVAILDGTVNVTELSQRERSVIKEHFSTEAVRAAFALDVPEMRTLASARS